MNLKESFIKNFNIKFIDGHIFVALFKLRFRIKYKQRYSIPVVKENGITAKTRKIPVVASLTSFPDRINTLHITIKSLLVQDFKPDYLVLYLAENQFENKEKDLPQNLLELKKYGLEIRWYIDDIRSYKKLIPALNDFKNSIIITFDDDIVYKKNTISTLYNAYLKDSKNIYAQRSARIYLEDDTIKNLKSNELYIKDFNLPSFKNRLTGCAGVLYPPNCFYKDIDNKELFFNLIPTHDDVWFWTMAVLNGTKIGVVKGFRESITTIEDSQKVGLCKENNTQTGISTTQAYKIMVQKYPELINKLKEENE